MAVYNSAEWHCDEIVTHVKKLQEQITALETKAAKEVEALVGGVIQPVVTYPILDSSRVPFLPPIYGGNLASYTPQPYRVGSYPYERTMPNADGAYYNGRTYEQAVEMVERAWKDTQALKESNLAAIANNERVYLAAYTYMLKLGLKTKVTEKKSARSTKTVTVDAPWVRDLSAQIPRWNAWVEAERKYNNLVTQLKDWKRFIEMKQKALQAEAEKKAAEEAEIQQIGGLAVKYGLPAAATRMEIRAAILSVHPKLALAYWMERAHQYKEAYAVERIKYFCTLLQQNDPIRVELEDVFTHWANDMRIFRDMCYNYRKLFEDYEDSSALDDLNSLELRPGQWNKREV